MYMFIFALASPFSHWWPPPAAFPFLLLGSSHDDDGPFDCVPLSFIIDPLSQIQLVVCAERKKAKKPCATAKHTTAQNFLALLIPSLDGRAIVLRFSSCLYVSTVYVYIYECVFVCVAFSRPLQKKKAQM